MWHGISSIDIGCRGRGHVFSWAGCGTWRRRAGPWRCAPARARLRPRHQGPAAAAARGRAAPRAARAARTARAALRAASPAAQPPPPRRYGTPNYLCSSTFLPELPPLLLPSLPILILSRVGRLVDYRRAMHTL